jgi:hypothetical protein
MDFATTSCLIASLTISIAICLIIFRPWKNEDN